MSVVLTLVSTVCKLALQRPVFAGKRGPVWPLDVSSVKKLCHQLHAFSHVHIELKVP